MSPVTRCLAILPLSVTLTAAGGIALGAATHHPPLLLNVIIAAGAAIVGGLLGLLPIALARGSDQAGVAQASLVAMTVQLIATLAAGVGPWFAKMGLTQSVLWWLMAFYAISLVLLVLTLVQTLRQAPIVSSGATKKL